MQTARWNLEQVLVFVRMRYGKAARLSDLTRTTIQEWMDDMAAKDLSVPSMRTRHSTLSSFCTWLVKREMRVRVKGGRTRDIPLPEPVMRYLRNIRMLLKHGAKNINEMDLVVPTGFEPVSEP